MRYSVLVMLLLLSSCKDIPQVTQNNEVQKLSDRDAYQTEVMVCYKDLAQKKLVDAVKCDRMIMGKYPNVYPPNTEDLIEKYKNKELQLAQKYDAHKITIETFDREIKKSWASTTKAMDEREAKERNRLILEEKKQAVEQAKADREYARIQEENRPSNVKCRSYGFKKGSADFANCVMKVEQLQADEDRYQALLQEQRDLQQRSQERKRRLCLSQAFSGMAGSNDSLSGAIASASSYAARNCN